MKTLYLDCGMGAAGDMLAAALLELTPEPAEALARLNGLGLPNVTFQMTKSEKCGITGTHLTVLVAGEEKGDHHPHHHHRGMAEIEALITSLALSPKVREDVLAVYRLLAAAESRVHGVPVSEIHFHEVGAMDAIADISAVCLLLDSLGVEQIVASPVHVGSGHVACAHGILPVPAPATAELLKDIPIYGGEIQGELCTPTGAALLRHFVSRFGPIPVMRPEAVGYGMGKKDFPMANCVRALLGQAEDEGEEILELSCNIDDMTAEELSFAMEQLLAAGAREVYTTPVGMKKSRTGCWLHVLCRRQEQPTLLRLMFRHTTTLGVREAKLRRYTLARTIETRKTAYGPVACKVSEGFGVRRRKLEYEDLARIARQQKISIAEARRLVEETWDGHVTQ